VNIESLRACFSAAPFVVDLGAGPVAMADGRLATTPERT